MKKKCEKFEGLFVFASEQDLNKHIENCEACKKEQQNFEDLTKLIKLAKPLYFEKKRNATKVKAIAAAFLTVLTCSVFSVLGYSTSVMDTVKYGQTLSAEDYGFPVDSYGLIWVDE